jgi:protoporphyrinogen/coproporphyrinogen III oxidase
VNGSGRPVVVIGGGISGLTTAFELVHRGVAPLLVLEAAERFGGKIRTETIDGIPVDVGPDSFLAREPWGVDLCERLGLAGELRSPGVFGAAVWSRGKLRPLPSGFAFGMPASPVSALRTGLLSPLGAARAAADFFRFRPLRGPDVAIGPFVRRRFGSQVLERLVDPLLAGTRAGDPARMSLEVGAPQIDAVARSNRSLILGLREARRRGVLETGAPPFLTIAAGLERLTGRLVERLQGAAELMLSTPVSKITSRERRADRSGGLDVVTDQGTIPAGRVVVTTPPFVTARLIEEVAEESGSELASIPYASAATSTFVFPPGSFEAPPATSGLLVPSVEAKTMAAATWYSIKWPHAAPDDGRQIVKCFAGRSTHDPAVSLEDETLTKELLRDLTDALGVSQAPLASHLTRWPRALPEYEVGHAERIARIEAGLRHLPEVVLAGSGYGGSGLPDCIRRASIAAELVGSSLPR